MTKLGGGFDGLDVEGVTDVVGVELLEALGAVSALEDEGPAHGGLGEALLEVARLFGNTTGGNVSIVLSMESTSSCFGYSGSCSTLFDLQLSTAHFPCAAGFFSGPMAAGLRRKRAATRCGGSRWRRSEWQAGEAGVDRGRRPTGATTASRRLLLASQLDQGRLLRLPAGSGLPPPSLMAGGASPARGLKGTGGGRWECGREVWLGGRRGRSGHVGGEGGGGRACAWG
ncbi:hypothetical protein U9M48_042340 [Paspalum notatum var. saurae]|uniref:Uncharacterized protein n=1 Tax=Paspalum notatum var. saurae TaxID=547442 RepID=A0AAQ3USE7_PASNO